MSSFTCLAVVATVAVLAMVSVEPAEAQDCSSRVSWPLFQCPDGDNWACWGNSRSRDENCNARGWLSNWKQFQNAGGFGNCYCCGACPIPV